jgi:hypothetical protein
MFFSQFVRTRAPSAIILTQNRTVYEYMNKTAKERKQAIGSHLSENLEEY